MTRVYPKLSHDILVEYRKFIDCAYKYTINKFPKKYAFQNKNQKYDLQLVIIEIIYFTKSGVSYKYYRGPINAKTLNTHVLFFAKHKIFENVYKILHDWYSKDKTYSKFKYQHIDTSYVMNKNGKEKLGRNKHFKNKNCYKLSSIVDDNRIANSTVIKPGNKNDTKIGLVNIDKIDENMKIINSKCKPYILADKMYDTNEFREKCISNNYKPIIDYNKRNTKNNKLIKKLTRKDKRIYKKRIKVENTFCILKKYKRIQLIYESYLSTYTSFIYLAQCLMINRFI